jgi:hypothetical protein
LQSETTGDNVAVLPVAHGRGGAPTGNSNARRSGFYSKALQPRELRHLDAIAEELRDLMGDSYSPRFEPALTALAGQLWRWQRAQEYLHRHDVSAASATLLRDLGTLENSLRLGMARLGLDLDSAVALRVRIERHRGQGPDVDKLTGPERRQLERLVEKARRHD